MGKEEGVKAVRSEIMHKQLCVREVKVSEYNGRYGTGEVVSRQGESSRHIG